MSFSMALARALLGNKSRSRLQRLSLDAGIHGYDSFGAHRDGAAIGEALTSFLYERYFRVVSEGAENIPATGPVIIASNHSGTLPFDGMMIYRDLLEHTEPPRLPRPIADRFVASLPMVSTLFARGGVVGGSRKNVEHLLERGEMLMVFPEGTPGISKPFTDRYQLQTWREGHAELALRFGAAIVPTAVIGAEEQMPMIAKLPIRAFGAPFLPITATPLPLPVRYHIRYGAPLRLERDPVAADTPETVHALSERVRDAVQLLIDEGLAKRSGVFR